MPAYPQAQYQPMMSAQPSMHSSATLAVPMGYDPFAGLGAPSPSSNEDYRRSSAAKSSSRGSHQEEEEDEDEVNILAVIIFGSLSVTALGGLGMLILLMFTTG